MRLLLVFIFPLVLFAADKTSTFSNESSLSIVQTGGNSNSEAYNASTESLYKPTTREYQFHGNYTLSYADNPEVQNSKVEETARNWMVGATVTQDLARNFGAVAGINYEGNEFAGYKQRENADLGGKYTFYDTKQLRSSLEIGYRYTTEKRTVPNDKGRDVVYLNKANIQYNHRKKLNENVSFRFWIQYLPNFTNPEDYQINFEPSINVTMNQTFSLRVAYKGQYDNEPNVEGNEYLDYTTTTALVAKY